MTPRCRRPRFSTRHSTAIVPALSCEWDGSDATACTGRAKFDSAQDHQPDPNVAVDVSAGDVADVEWAVSELLREESSVHDEFAGIGRVDVLDDLVDLVRQEVELLRKQVE